MNLKNYTTSISEEKTISEIEKILALNGVNSIFKMYDNEGKISALAFRVFVKDRDLAFKLPMEVNKVLMILKNSRIPNKNKTEDQARRTGWRIIKNWVESQMALIQINMVKIEEIFLPYMYDVNNDETLFEKLENRNFDLLLEHKPID